MRALEQQLRHRSAADPGAAELQAQLAAAVAAAADAFEPPPVPPGGGGSGGGEAAARGSARPYYDAPLPPPGPEVEGALRRALAAGWCDQVARRVRSAEYVRRLAREEGRKRWVAGQGSGTPSHMRCGCGACSPAGTAPRSLPARR